MTDTEIKKRLNVQIDLLDISPDHRRLARFVANYLAHEVAKIIKEETKKGER